MAKILLFIKNHLNLLSKKNISLSVQFQKAKTRTMLTIKENSQIKNKITYKKRV
jgi:hypothetical protein